MCISFLYSHEVRSVSVDEGTQGQATLPRHSKVCYINIPVSLRLSLAPVQQFTGSSYGFWFGRTRTLEARCKSSRLNRLWIKQYEATKTSSWKHDMSLAVQSHGLGQAGQGRESYSLVMASSFMLVPVLTSQCIRNCEMSKFN